MQDNYTFNNQADFNMRSGKDKIIIISIILIVFLFLSISRTLNSGYHFVDDHEVITIKDDLKSSALINVTKSWLSEDFKINKRFRPVYIINRVFETRVFGADLLLWSIYNGVLCCIALISFYFGMRRLKYSPAESIALLIITFIGSQSNVWWRLGPGESLGMVFLGFSFCGISVSKDKKDHFLNNSIFLLFLVLASLTKESFMLIIPGMIFLKVWHEKIIVWPSLKKAIHKNLILLVPLIVFFVELFIVKSYVGTISSRFDTNLINNIANILIALLKFVLTFLNLIIACIILAVIGFYLKKRIIKINYYSLIFFILLLIPNVMLYARLGLKDRYLLPASFGLGLFAIAFVKNIAENPYWLKRIAVTLIIISFIPNVVSAFTDARKFSIEGYSTKILLNSISANYRDSTKVLVVVDPIASYEKSVSLKKYLYHEDKIDLFGYPVTKDENNTNYNINGSVDGWKSYFEKKQYSDMTSKPGLLIFLDKGLIDSFFKQSDLLKQNYVPVEIGKSPYALLKEKT